MMKHGDKIVAMAAIDVACVAMCSHDELGNYYNALCNMRAKLKQEIDDVEYNSMCALSEKMRMAAL